METICADGQCLKDYLLIILNGKKNASNFDEKFI